MPFPISTFNRNLIIKFWAYNESNNLLCDSYTKIDKVALVSQLKMTLFNKIKKKLNREDIGSYDNYFILRLNKLSRSSMSWISKHFNNILLVNIYLIWLI
jgi:hypothetical protein